MAPPNAEQRSEQPAVSRLKAAEIALSDPLKAETRRARLYLLGVSLVGITIVQTGLVPQEISTLGITFGEADRRSLLSMLALVIVYFASAFAIYGVSDFIAWRYAYSNVHWSELRTEAAEARKLQEEEAAEARKRKLQEEEAAEARGIDLKKAREEAKVLQIKAEAAQADLEKAWEQVCIVLGKSKEDEATWETIESLPEEHRTELEQLLRNSELAWKKAAVHSAVLSSDIMRPVSLPVPVPLDALSLANLEAQKTITKYSTLAPTVSWIRALFEFLLPLLVSFYALYTLLFSW